MVRKKESPAPYFGPMRTARGPTFMERMLEVPSREEMQSAIGQAIDAIVFKVNYLSHDDYTCVSGDMGGLDCHAFSVGLAMEAGARLAAMYEALTPDDPEDEELDKKAAAAVKAATAVQGPTS